MWIRLDDNFADSPKIVAAGSECGWLWIMSIAYANRFTTNGFVPATELSQLTRTMPNKSRAKRSELAKKLCAVSLWEETARNGVVGYQIHDYLDYQPSRKEIQKSRKQSRLRQAKWRRTRVKASRAH